MSCTTSISRRPYALITHTVARPHGRVPGAVRPVCTPPHLTRYRLDGLSLVTGNAVVSWPSLALRHPPTTPPIPPPVPSPDVSLAPVDTPSPRRCSRHHAPPAEVSASLLRAIFPPRRFDAGEHGRPCPRREGMSKKAGGGGWCKNAMTGFAAGEGPVVQEGTPTICRREGRTRDSRDCSQRVDRQVGDLIGCYTLVLPVRRHARRSTMM